MIGAECLPLARPDASARESIEVIAQMDFFRHMAPELWLALFLVCMSGALVAAYLLSR
jgi:hypothetical protein